MPRLVSVPVLRRYTLHARLLWASAPGMSLVCLILTVVTAGASAGSLVTTGRLVAALSKTDPDAMGWTIATAVSFLVIPVASSVLAYTSRVVSGRYLVMVCDATLAAGADPYGIAHLEDPRLVSELEAISGAPRDWLFQAGVEATWSLLAIRLSGVGAFVVVASWSWWPPILLAAAWLIYSRFFARWSATIFDGLLELTGTERRRAGYLRDLLVGSAGAKEVRLFGLVDLLVSRHVSTWNNAQKIVWENRATTITRTLLVLIAPMIGLAIALIALVVDVDHGLVDAGLLVTMVQALSAMAAFGPHTDAQTSLARTLSAVVGLDKIRSLGRLPRVPSGSTPTTTTEPRFPRTGSAGPTPAAIELVNVSFSYPSAKKPTLKGLNLQIPAGQSLALVGVNGAGKSTLIKLLCGLYRPDSGSIRIDGADPAGDGNARRRLAVIFQDFVRYDLSLRDNIAVGLEKEVVARALHDAGGDEILERLECGFDTVLSSAYDGGTDLSGGQWQRVALARALAALSRDAGALVLDEPTAALDVRAESALFDRFIAVARGATTILVSHRLSSVRHAERIVVLADTGDGARIVEDGNHAQLLRADGRYARLFRLQASRFARAEGSR